MTVPAETSSPTVLDYRPPTSPKRSRAWLFFSILAIALWGVWGAVSKAASNAVPSPTDLQVISTVGVVPIALLLVFSPNFLKRTGRSEERRVGKECKCRCGTVNRRRRAIRVRVADCRNVGNDKEGS